MKIIHKARAPKARRAIINAADKWEPVVREGFLRALVRARAAFRHDVVAAALARGAPEIAVAAMPWPQLERALEANLLHAIRNAMADGAAAAVRDLKPIITKADGKDPKKPPTNFQVGADVSFTLDNPRTQNYLARYAARFVTRLKNESMLAIRRITTDAHARGENVRQQADRIASELRRNVGLNQRQAGALGRYEAALIEQEVAPSQIAQQIGEYRDRMIDQRASVIAQHETITASNQGQNEVWQQATEQGLLEPEQKRRWLAQPGINADNPCPICRPMDGQIRGLNEEFVSPYDGSRAMVPGIHIGCRCVVTLHFED